MKTANSKDLDFIWKALSVIAIGLYISNNAFSQTVPPYQSHNFQYLTGALTSSSPTSTYTANSFNAIFPSKYFSMGVTATPASSFQIALEGSLDNSNWSLLSVTNSAVGVVSSILPKPMLFFRMRATSIGANDTITATAIGTP